jgi:hypothetical protein
MASDRHNLGFSAAGEREACNGSASEIMERQPDNAGRRTLCAITIETRLPSTACYRYS